MTTTLTRYIANGETSASTGNSTETQSAIARRTAGTFSNFYLRLLANTVSATSTFRFRSALANGNQVISVGSSTAGEFTDTSHSDTVTAGTLTSVQAVTGGTGTSLVVGMVSFQFLDGGGSTTKRFASCSGSQYASTTTLAFIGLVGGTGATNATETAVQFKMKTAGTLKNLFTNVTTNTLTKTTTLVSRINTANGAMALSILTTAQGVFEDTSNTDTISSGTLVAYGVSTASGGSGAITFNNVSSEFTTADSTNHMVSGDGSASVSINPGVTGYAPWGGLYDDSTANRFTATESEVQAPAHGPYIVSNLLINIQSNTLTAASTLTFRKNAAGGNQTVSITANTAGFFEDATHTDIVQAPDEVNYKFVGASSGTSIGLQEIGTLVTYNLLMPMWMGDQPAIIYDRTGVVSYGEI